MARISFHTHVVHIISGGKSLGTLTRYSLPGDKPETWTVALDDPDGVLPQAVRGEGLSTAFPSRHDAECWALPHALVLAEHAQDKARFADQRALAELALA